MITQDTHFNPDAIFNIGTVTRLTGIPVNTLHVWERRYGFPHSSARTPGGHRLYSGKDISLLRSIKAHIDQGVSARQAVTMVQKLDELGTQHPTSLREPPPIGTQTAAFSSSADELSIALLHHDLEHANQLLAEMLTNYSPGELTVEVISPVWNRIGEAWGKKDISIATEHLSSNFLRQHLFMWMETGPILRKVQPIVLACPPGEWHEGGLLMLGVLLRQRGWPISYLGQNMPFADLAGFIDQMRPRVVVLVGMQQETVRTLSDWPKWIPQTAGRPEVAFAGREFVVHPAFVEKVPGIYLGDTLTDGISKLEELLG